MVREFEQPGTRRMYHMSIREFIRFPNIVGPEEIRQGTRTHVIARRKSLMTRNLVGAATNALDRSANIAKVQE
jgi:hypothetical protein